MADVDLSLVLLAGGLGSRFGGPKQLAPVGPAGEPLLVVTAQHAIDAGFGEFVVLTRTDLREEITAAVASIDAPVHLVMQDEHGPPRAVPGGTAHAVAACAEVLKRPFGVANADDYYGIPSFAVLADALRNSDERTAVIVGFELGATLSPHGGVARAVCHATGGFIDMLAEHRGFRRDGNGSILDERGEEFPSDTIVSMNLWGFPSWIPATLAERFDGFASHATGNAEFLLPDEIDRCRVDGRLDIRLVTSDGGWAGLTFADDLADVRQVIADDSRRSTSPGSLFDQ